MTAEDQSSMPSGLSRAGSLLFYLLAYAAVLIVGTVIESTLFGIGSSLDALSHVQTNRVIGYPIDEHCEQRQSVILLDEETLKIKEWEWPVRYDDQAKALKAIREREPMAVMVDILFLTFRAEEGLEKLLEEIKNYEQAGIPLFIAAPPWQPGSEDEVLPPIQDVVLESDIVEFVPVNLISPIAGDGRDEWAASLQYPSFGQIRDERRRETTAFRLARLVKNRDRETESTFHSAAAEASSAFEGELPTLRRPLTLMWGTNPRQILDRNGSCGEPSGFEFLLDTWVGRLVSSMFNSHSLTSQCPFIDTLRIDELDEVSKSARNRHLIRDRVVFYGQNLTAAEDVRLSPTHGVVPSVYIHAMALDNLIRFPDKGYFSESGEVFGNRLTKSWLEVLLGAACIVLFTTLAMQVRVIIARRCGNGMKASYLKLLSFVVFMAIALVGLMYLQRVFVYEFSFAPLNWIGLFLTIGAVFSAELVEFPSRLKGRLKSIIGP